MNIFKNANFNFLRWRWQAMALSLLVIGAGVFVMLTRGIPLGVEFSGGTNLIVRFAAPVAEDQIRRALQAIPHEVQQYGEPGSNQMLIRLPQTQEAERGGNLSADVPRVQEMLKAAGLPGFQIEGTEIVGPTVGAELRRQAIYATVLSMLGITAWIAIRFRVSFAMGSIVATFHDVLVTLAFLAFFRYEMTLNVIAAMLTMVGYSMNDMIVIFDRVREYPAAATGAARVGHQHELEPDADADRDHVGYGLHRGACTVSLWWGSAERICVHDARGHHRNHVFRLVHCAIAGDHAQQEAVPQPVACRR
jgi:preprotein translocase subunit SecF